MANFDVIYSNGFWGNGKPYHMNSQNTSCSLNIYGNQSTTRSVAAALPPHVETLSTPVFGGTQRITDPARMLPAHTEVTPPRTNYVDDGFRFFEDPGMNHGQFDNAVPKDRVRLPEGFSGIRRQPKVNLDGVKPVGGNTPSNNGNTPIDGNTPVNNPDNTTPSRKKTSRQERLREIRNNPEKRARYKKFKLANNPELKARYDKFSKFKKMQGLKKAGKWGLLAAGALALGALLLNKCSGNNKPVPVVPPTDAEQQPAAPTEPETPTTPEEPTVPVAPTEPEQPTEPTFFENKAKWGDNYWNYAKEELIREHQPGYVPSDKEILERTKEIMARNGVGLAADGIHSDPLLKVGDNVKLTYQL